MKAIVFLAEGFEDMEALATRDVLLRGGVEVLTVSLIEDWQVDSSHGVTVIADMSWPDFRSDIAVEADDVMIFPGGMPGSRNLAAHQELMDLMKDHYAAGGAVAAICAAPGLVLSQLDHLEGRRFTCFEGFQDALIAKGAVFTPEPAVIDAAGSAADAASECGAMITGRGAGHAIAFGLAILEHLKGPEAVAKVRSGLML